MVNCLNLAYLVIYLPTFQNYCHFSFYWEKESTLGGRLFPAKFGGLYMLLIAIYLVYAICLFLMDLTA